MYKQNELIKLQDHVIEQMTEGKSLASICNKKGTISSAEVYRLLNKDKDFRDRYTHARVQQALFYAEKMQQTIHDLPKKPSREELDKARLSIDTDKFIAARLLPKVYGNTLNQTNIQVNNIKQITGMNIIESENIEIPANTSNKNE